jgi:Fe-S-cluster containining protein
MNAAELVRRDGELLAILDQWFARAAARAGDQIACHAGCAQCCMGAFAIDRLAALRLQRGLDELKKSAPERAQRVLERAALWLERQGEFFPGSLESGLIDETSEALEQFEEFANDEACPALDPETKRCELYAHRPLTCRLFGAPLATDEGIGICELCFTTAAPEAVAEALVPLDGEELEARLNGEAERGYGTGRTIVAFALLGA